MLTTFKIVEKLDTKYYKIECTVCGISLKTPYINKFPECPCQRNKKEQNKVSLPKKAINFTKAVSKFAFKSLKERKLQIVSAEQYEERLNICNDCDFRHPIKPICTKCGCKTKGLLNKAQLKTEKCPLGKWPILYDTTIIQSK